MIKIEDLKDKDCELCELKKVTPWHYETENWVIIDCKVCKVPMYVYRSHGDIPGAIEREMLKDAKKRFHERRIDKRKRKIFGHYHFHCR